MWENVGNYYYAFPTYSQGRKAIWEGRGKDGVAYRDHFPKELVEKTHDGLMQIRYKNGSLLQIVGVEDADSLVGTNPRGIVFSEYSLQNPKAWDLMRPILAENEGWAIFNYTPRGKNHGHKLFEMAKKNPKWWVSMLTVNDTNVLTPEDIEEERLSGMTEDMVQQEYFCSFTAAIQGSYYWEQVDKAERNGQFKEVPHDPKMLVHTVWDLGKNDHNCIGFYQSDGVSVRKIDYLTGGRKSLGEWIKEVKEKPYVYGKHFGPHDIEVSDYTQDNDQTRREYARGLGLEFDVVPNMPIVDGIDAGRRFFSKLYIDTTKCADFIDAIAQYTKVYDEENKTFKNKPLHDWTSNFADEHRYAAIVHAQFNNETDQATVMRIVQNRHERSDARADSGA
jgi:phage terminase large subunit